MDGIAPMGTNNEASTLFTDARDNRCRHRVRRAGFSLIELSTALFVVTVGTFGVITMFFYGLNEVRAIADSRVAVRAVQNELETRRALPFDQLTPGESPFLSKTPEIDRLESLRATVIVADQTLATPGRSGGLRSITATVNWVGEHGRPIEKHLSTLVADKGR